MLTTRVRDIAEAVLWGFREGLYTGAESIGEIIDSFYITPGCDAVRAELRQLGAEDVSDDALDEFARSIRDDFLKVNAFLVVSDMLDQDVLERGEM